MYHMAIRNFTILKKKYFSFLVLYGTMAIWPYYNHTTHMAKMVKMVLKHKHGPYLRVSHLF